MPTTIEAGLHAGLLEWLTRHGIEHETHEHRMTFTARETARAEGVELGAFAKVVGVEAGDGQRALVVLRADDRLSLTKIADVMQARHVRLLNERQLAELAPGCEAGAIPAVGILFGVPLYADAAIRDDPSITFNAGSHRFSIRVEREAWDRAARPSYHDLAERYEDRPAWVNS